ncbi:MAG: cytochrome c [Pedobacter sp.]|jgi:mono/diheme cytochrome c family protein
MLILRFVILLICLSTLVLSFTGIHDAQPPPWKAPVWADTLYNPYAVEPLTLPQAQEVYNLYCVSCHGNQGQGLVQEHTSQEVPDFKNEAIMKQSDGALFWKIREGRGIMPGFKSKLSDEQYWQLVEYIRDLSKPFNLQKNPFKTFNN